MRAQMQPHQPCEAIINAHADHKVVAVAIEPGRILDRRVLEGDSRRQREDGKGRLRLVRIEEGAAARANTHACMRDREEYVEGLYQDGSGACGWIGEVVEEGGLGRTVEGG